VCVFGWGIVLVRVNLFLNCVGHFDAVRGFGSSLVSFKMLDMSLLLLLLLSSRTNVLFGMRYSPVAVDIYYYAGSRG